MSAIDLSHYKTLYVTTSKEQLEKLREGVISLVANHDNSEGVDAVYINAHTLVSKSLMMGYTEFASVCKEIERIFLAVREKKFSITTDLLDTLSKAGESMSEDLSIIEQEGKEIDLSKFIEDLKKYQI